MTDDNPYRVTAAATVAVPADPDTEPSETQTIVGWTIVFGLNLPVPVLFGVSVVNGLGGYLGMATGCVMWWGTGVLLCRRGRVQNVRATSWGGLLVAGSQFFPMLQMCSGMAAIAIMTVLVAPQAGNGRGGLQMAVGSPLLDHLVATGLTLLTGTILISVAAIIGHLIMFLYRRLKPASSLQESVTPKER